MKDLWFTANNTHKIILEDVFSKKLSTNYKSGANLDYCIGHCVLIYCTNRNC